MIDNTKRQIFDPDKYNINYVKLVASLGFISLGITNIFILLNPVQGYELSFYNGIPQIAWFFLLVASFSGVYIGIYEIYTRHCCVSNTWICGLVIILISRVNFLLIPYSRGYIGWRGDHMTHVGFVKDLISHPNISIDNFYPITHIIIKLLSISSNIPFDIVIMTSTAFLSAFFVLSYYLLGRFFFKDKRIVILTIVFLGCVFLSDYDLFLRPNAWGVLLLPFCMYLILRAIEPGNISAFPLLAAIVIILAPFIHLYNGFIFIIIFMILLILNCIIFLSNKLKDIKTDRITTPKISIVLILLTLLSVIFSYWTLLFHPFYNNIKIIFETIQLSRPERDVIGSMAGTVDKLQLDFLELISLIFKIEGTKIVVLLLFFIGIYLYYLNPEFLHKSKINLMNSYIIATFFFGTAYFFFILGVPGFESFAGERFLRYTVVFAALFIGVTSLHILSYKNNLITIVYFLLICFVFYVSLFGLIPSPHIERPNPHFTLMDMKGMVSMAV